MMNEVDWWGLETQHSDTVTRDELKTSLAAAIARAEAAESELSKYRQWHEQAQIRAVDAEFELAQFMDDMIACLGLPDREYGDSVGEVIVAAVTKIIARAEAAEALAASVFQDTGEFVGKLYEVLGRELDYEEGSSFDEIVGAVAALRARVAELEAAQAWRPVTEDEPAEDERVLAYLSFTSDEGAFAMYDFGTRQGKAFITDDNRAFYIDLLPGSQAYYQPLPLPPTSDNS